MDIHYVFAYEMTCLRLDKSEIAASSPAPMSAIESRGLKGEKSAREEKNSSAGEKPVCLVYYNEGELCE